TSTFQDPLPVNLTSNKENLLLGRSHVERGKQLALLGCVKCPSHLFACFALFRGQNSPLLAMPPPRIPRLLSHNGRRLTGVRDASRRRSPNASSVRTFARRLCPPRCEYPSRPQT